MDFTVSLLVHVLLSLHLLDDVQLLSDAGFSTFTLHGCDVFVLEINNAFVIASLVCFAEKVGHGVDQDCLLL